jgi:CBS domain-containing protein
LPVVSDDGRPLGVLSVDDVVDRLAPQLGAVAGSLRYEQAIERNARR